MRNKLKSLDLSQVPNLRTLYCYENRLESLDLSHVLNLQTLKCSENYLSQLHLPQLPNLQKLNLATNFLTEIDLSRISNLLKLNLSDNQLTQLDLSQLLDLKLLKCAYNQLTQLDVTLAPNLRRINFSYNQISVLAITNQQLNNLKTFIYDNNPIQFIDEELRIINRQAAKAINSIIHDKQSVHAETITSSVIATYNNLKKYPPMHNVLDVINNDKNISDETKRLINKYSRTKDKHSELDLNYEEALALVYPHHTKNSLVTFNEEVLSSVEHGLDVCLTGKITRLANSLNGYIPDVKITIGIKEELSNMAIAVAGNDEVKNKYEAFMELIRKRSMIS
jgi:Leucine-rich repeat (LRR) protein